MTPSPQVENLVRLAFLDESGRSRREPMIVVAGVIVHGDRTYRQLEAKLKQIVSEEIPPEHQEGFVFHAKDLFHGSRYFDRERWPRLERHRILHRLASIPSEFGLPVVFGNIEKSTYVLSPEVMDPGNNLPFGRDKEVAIEVGQHVSALMLAEIAIERQMYHFQRDEVSMLICEDTDRVKSAVKQAHAFLKSDKLMNIPGFAEQADLPLRKIVDTPHFAAKADSLPLQVADLCAFLIMRRLRRSEDTQPFFESIAPQLFWTASEFGAPMGAEPIAAGSRY